MSFFLHGTAHYSFDTTCPVRKRWDRDYCMHAVYNTVRHETYYSYLKETTKCLLTKPNKTVAIKIETMDRRTFAESGMNRRRYKVSNG